MDLIELARQHIQTENDHDVPATMATISENGADYKIWSNNESFASRQAIEDFYQETIAAIPNMNIQIDNIIQDKDRRQVFVQYTLTGKQEKTLWGLAATKKTITYHGAIIYEFDQHGKLIREETYFDKTELLASLGIIRDTATKLGIFLLILPQSPILAIRSALKALFGKKKTRQAVRLVRH